MDYAIESPCCVILMVLWMQMTEDALNFLRKETVVQAITRSSTKASYETGRMFVWQMLVSTLFIILCATCVWEFHVCALFHGVTEKRCTWTFCKWLLCARS